MEPVRGSAAYAEQQTAMEYGVPSFVIADDIWDANKGKTPAFSANGQIYFRESVPQRNAGMLAYPSVCIFSVPSSEFVVH